MMRALQKQVLNGRSVDEMLRQEGFAIKSIIESKVELTFAAKKEHGYVTGKITPVPKKG